MSDPDSRDVVIAGGGVSGLTAGIFTARAGLETLIVTDNRSILERNAHLENVPGFPAGVNSRLFLSMTRDQATCAGCSFVEDTVTNVEETDDGFAVHAEDGVYLSTRVVAASWSDADYLDGLDVDLEKRGSKRFVLPEPDGRTAVE